MGYRIGEVAKIIGCQIVTIRFYEKEGILKKPSRTEKNYRVYSEKDIERLQLIRRCRLYGMSLAEIRKLLALNDNPPPNCHWIHDFIEKQITNIQNAINDLLHLKSHLEAMANKCEGNSEGECRILQDVISREECAHCKKIACRDYKRDK